MAAPDDAPAPRPAATARPLTRVLTEAARLVVVGALLAAASGILRGVPTTTAILGETPTTCGAPLQARPEVAWIEQGEARPLLDDAQVTFVDARPRDVFEAGHVTGAVNVPMDTGAIDAAATQWMQGTRTIITYCDTNGDCASSKRLAGLLAEAGLPDVRVLRGGMPAWLENQYPAEAGPCRACP